MCKSPLSELIFKKYHWMVNFIGNQVELSQYNELTCTQAAALATIANGTHRPSSIATQLGVSRQAIHKTLKELQAHEMVLQQQDPTHKKAVIVKLTKKGTEANNTVCEISLLIEQRLTQQFGHESTVLLKKVLQSDW